LIFFFHPVSTNQRILPDWNGKLMLVRHAKNRFAASAELMRPASKASTVSTESLKKAA